MVETDKRADHRQALGINPRDGLNNVADQEFISQLESRIRSAKYGTTSKQISQNLNSIEYPWQFETRVTFPIEVQKQNAYGPRGGVKPTKPLSTQKAATQDRNEGVQVHRDEKKKNSSKKPSVAQAEQPT